MKVEILDAEARARQYPDFEIPSLSARKTLHPGDWAKLMFSFPDGGVERMWVRVTKGSWISVRGRNVICYHGTLENAPIHRELQIGMHVVFWSTQIIDLKKASH